MARIGGEFICPTEKRRNLSPRAVIPNLTAPAVRAHPRRNDVSPSQISDGDKPYHDGLRTLDHR